MIQSLLFRRLENMILKEMSFQKNMSFTIEQPKVKGPPLGLGLPLVCMDIADFLKVLQTTYLNVQEKITPVI